MKDVVILHIFLINRGLEMAKLPECFHGNIWTKVYNKLGFCMGTNTFYLAKH